MIHVWETASKQTTMIVAPAAAYVINKMPIPNPKGPEAKKDFVSRCMSDSVLTEEFPDEKQRAAVCYSKWRNAKGSEYIPEDEDSDFIIY